MYKIGEFSKIVNIPIRTLRYYAEYGVLIPSTIDKYTGYKYYSEDDVIECEQIKLLKSLDFTLDEIIRYKNNINEDVLDNKKKELEDKMKLLKLKYKKLEFMKEEVKNNKCNSLFDKTEDEKVLRRINDEKGNDKENN